MTATTAPTPEELAKKLDHMSDISLLYSPNDAVDLGDEAAAMIRAQAVKIADLTAERDASYQRGYDARQAEIVQALAEAGGSGGEVGNG